MTEPSRETDPQKAILEAMPYFVLRAVVLFRAEQAPLQGRQVREYEGAEPIKALQILAEVARCW